MLSLAVIASFAWALPNPNWPWSAPAGPSRCPARICLTVDASKGGR